MDNWKESLISPDTPIFEAVRIVDNSGLQIALIVDEKKRLLGTITDGDVRRAILNHIPLDTEVDKIMYTSPTTAGARDKNDDILSLMRRKEIRQIPIVDASKRVVGLRSLIEILQPQKRENAVVLMAGGLGKRLLPLTEKCPKPLLKVGDKPILETILEGFIDSGFINFYISVNYKADMIEKHFGDGAGWGVNINYLKEDKPLGTAGALGLLPKINDKPIIVMNGDILTKINMEQLLEFHCNTKVQATMAVREYEFQVPYGVVYVEDNYLAGLDEKPIHRFFVNAGIYVIEQDIIEMIPQGEFINMTDFFEQLMKKGLKITTFPIHEYWLDIGQAKDFEKANGDYCSLNNKSQA